MKYLRILLLVATTFVGMGAASIAAAQNQPDLYQVIRQYPHDPNAFTQGLIYENGTLYESTGLYGASTLRKVDLITGAVITKVDVPAQYFAEGMTLFQGKIFQLTWQSHVGFIYDPATFAKIGQFSYAGEGWGLTHDSQYLIMSDGTSQIRFLDPTTFQSVRTINVTDLQGNPLTRLNELEYINGEIFANVWQTNLIVRIDPATGTFLGWLDLAGLLPAGISADVLNGIAYDNVTEHLLVTGKLWPYLYELELASNSSTQINVTPTSLAGNGTLSASWGGISAPTSMDWIGLFVPGAPAGSYIDWIYVSCSKTPGAPAAAGSCPFVLPNVAPGTYELRLFTNNGFTVLAKSNTFTVTGGATSLTVTPTSVAGNGTLTASWSGITAPTSTNWIGLFVPGAASGSYIDWIYVSCSKIPGAPVAAGSCPFVLPNVAPGTYELRLFANNGFTVLTKSNVFTVTVTGATSLNVTPTSVAGNATLTASWSGVSAPTSADWVGLFVPGAASGSYIDWIYVSCSKVPGGPVAAGSCPFVLPHLGPGTYELRLFTNNSFTVLAKSNTFMVTP